MTVDPELYSTMVSVCPGLTLFSSRFKAYAGALAYYSPEASRDKSRTGHRLDVVRRMHRHHLGVDPNAIFPVRIQAVRDLDQGQRRRGFRVKVVPDRVRPPVYVQRIRHGVMTCRSGGMWKERPGCHGNKLGRRSLLSTPTPGNRPAASRFVHRLTYQRIRAHPVSSRAAATHLNYIRPLRS